MSFGIVKANVSMRQIRVVDMLPREWAKLVSEIDFAFAAPLSIGQSEPGKNGSLVIGTYGRLKVT